MEHRGYDIEETAYTTAVKVGSREETRPVYVIPGLKERLTRPILTTWEEAIAYIDAELSAREEREGEEFRATLKTRGAASVGLTVPADVARRLGLDVGDRVRVRLIKDRWFELQCSFYPPICPKSVAIPWNAARIPAKMSTHWCSNPIVRSVP